ncbi:MAG: tetratricopeptide repeat protein [Treponema sp.]|nr:tetratricopeptide repeat protein [Treponema sp.]
MFFLIIFAAAVSCDMQSKDADPYYITGSKEDREKFHELFRLLAMETRGSDSEFAVAREIAANYARLADYDRLIRFLSARTINNPSDPYNAYYFLMIAFANIQRNCKEIAALYFDLILRNYPDLMINDESIHLMCLRHLIDQNDNAERQVFYYRELISRFPEKIDMGTTFFLLGQACEKVGDWNGAISAYINFLPFTGTIITGYPDAERYAKQLVDFSRSQKDWTFESLSALRGAVEAALDAGSAAMLGQYQAKVNFFARSWQQVETDEAGLSYLNLQQFMAGNRIRYADSLDAASTDTEAFLRTSGWSQVLNTWYLYFRKINFPQDPEIHGRWEWAGIYYGEKF